MTKRSLDAAGIQPKPKLYSDICAMGLRKGKWTDEEEKYAAMIISHFESNLLPLCEQRESTIRLYLGKQLHCDPMRISKKFAGNNSVGKHFFCKKLENGMTQADEALENARAVRKKMRLAFIESVEKEFEAASKRPKRIRIRNRKKKKQVENQLLQWDDFSDDDLGELQSLLDDERVKHEEDALQGNVCVTPHGSPAHEYPSQHPQTPPSAPVPSVFLPDKFVLDSGPVCAPTLAVVEPQVIPVMNVNVPLGYTLVCAAQARPWALHASVPVTYQVGQQTSFDSHLDAILGCEDEVDNFLDSL